MVFGDDCSVTTAGADAIARSLCDSSFLQSVIGLAGAVIALIFAAVFTKIVLNTDPGKGAKVAIATEIHNGARAFLHTEYKYLALFIVAMLGLVGGAVSGVNENSSGIYSAICLLVGAILSASAGYLGMYIATKANVRTTEACETSLNAGLAVAFKSGAVMALSVVGLSLLGLTILFLIFASHSNPWSYISGFGFGASSIALFARVGGGVYTKAADVGADLVGKVESKIPEDSPLNPATIADNVGDNVGDVAGMGADLFESYSGSIIAASSLAMDASLGGALGKGGLTVAYRYSMVALPFWVAGLGVVASIAGIFLVRTSKGSGEKTEDDIQNTLLWTIRIGIFAAAGLVIGLSAIPCWVLFAGTDFAPRIFFVIIIGLVAGNVIGSYTEYVTAYEFAPTKGIAEKSETGPATVIIEGLGVGMISCCVPAITLVITVLASDALAGVYGVSIAAVGMLSTLGVTLATDAYGPVADNAGGIAEMDPAVPEHVRERTDALDALGNTTAATGKGFAIGSAVLTSAGLIAAYQIEAGVTAVDLADPPVLMATLIGAMLPFLFAALTMLSVGKSAEMIIYEVRQQFYADPLILFNDYLPEAEKEKHLPNSGACVAISTQAALQEMVIPGFIAVFSPGVVGFLLGAPALAGMLVGGLTSGFMLAVTMANAGGAWDNAKKYVEKGGLTSGAKKGSEQHAATVVGDTVGDPFKDTSGPALNILIKLQSIVSLVLAPLFKSASKTEFTSTGWALGMGILAFMIIFVVIFNHHAAKFYDAKKEDVEKLQQSKLGGKSLEQSAYDLLVRIDGAKMDELLENYPELKQEEAEEEAEATEAEAKNEEEEEAEAAAPVTEEAAPAVEEEAEEEAAAPVTEEAEEEAAATEETTEDDVNVTTEE